LIAVHDVGHRPMLTVLGRVSRSGPTRRAKLGQSSTIGGSRPPNVRVLG
jgi:hypothetical protein